MKKGQKFTLTGMGNDGFRYYCIFRKNEAFKKISREFMEKLGFDGKGVPTELYDYDLEKKIKMNSVKDQISNYKNNDFEVDIFYGDRKVILVIRTKKRAQLIRTLEEYSGWAKIKEVKKKPKKKK
jgi:hypothetical protein